MKIPKIILQFFVGIISASIINLFLSLFIGGIFAMLTGGNIKDNSFSEIFFTFVWATGIPLGEFLGISLCLRLMEEKINYLYLFLTTTSLATIIFTLQLIFGNLSSDHYLVIAISSGILTLAACLFTVKQAKTEQIKPDPVTKSSGFWQKYKILGQFFAGLLGSFVFCILSVIIALSIPRPSYVFGQEEYFFGYVVGFLLPIAFAFGSLFGIWTALKLANEKANFLYSTLLATVLCIVEFLTIQYLPTVHKQIFWLFIFGEPLALTFMANLPISKPKK